MIELFSKNLLSHNLICPFFLLINLISHILIMRLIGIKYFRSILIGFFLGLTFLIIYNILYIYKNNFNFYILNNFIIYLLLSFFYFAILSTYKTSIRLRVLFEIYENKEGLNRNDIVKNYNYKEIINIRLSRMIQNNQINFHMGKYYSKYSITLIIAIFLDIFKLLLFGNSKCNFKFFNKEKI